MTKKERLIYSKRRSSRRHKSKTIKEKKIEVDIKLSKKERLRKIDKRRYKTIEEWEKQNLNSYPTI